MEKISKNLVIVTGIVLFMGVVAYVFSFFQEGLYTVGIGIGELFILGAAIFSFHQIITVDMEPIKAKMLSVSIIFIIGFLMVILYFRWWYKI